MNALVAATWHVDFPHGAATLRVLREPAQCPTCKLNVLLAVVPPEQPESAKCLACTGPAPVPNECLGCAIVMTEAEAKRGWCDACEREARDEESTWAGGNGG